MTSKPDYLKDVHCKRSYRPDPDSPPVPPQPGLPAEGPAIIGEACFSSDHTKRYWLFRQWRRNGEEFRAVNFLMLNPSTADDQTNDATVRKCIGFAKRWGYNALIVTNLLPFITTNPWTLPHWKDRGDVRVNEFYVRHGLSKASDIVAAWGSVHTGLAARIGLLECRLRVMELMEQSFDEKKGLRVLCIGTTQNGSPLHPSRPAYTDEPCLWPSWGGRQ